MGPTEGKVEFANEPVLLEALGENVFPLFFQLPEAPTLPGSSSFLCVQSQQRPAEPQVTSL